MRAVRLVGQSHRARCRAVALASRTCSKCRGLVLAGFPRGHFQPRRRDSLDRHRRGRNLTRTPSRPRLGPVQSQTICSQRQSGAALGSRTCLNRPVCPVVGWSTPVVRAATTDPVATWRAAYLSRLIRSNRRRHLLVQETQTFLERPADHRRHPRARASLALRLVKVVWVGRQMAGKPGIHRDAERPAIPTTDRLRQMEVGILLETTRREEAGGQIHVRLTGLTNSSRASHRQALILMELPAEQAAVFILQGHPWTPGGSQSLRGSNPDNPDNPDSPAVDNSPVVDSILEVSIRIHKTDLYHRVAGECQTAVRTETISGMRTHGATETTTGNGGGKTKTLLGGTGLGKVPTKDLMLYTEE